MNFLSGQDDFFQTANQPISVRHLSQPYNKEFSCNQDKSYFHTDKIQYLCYLNLIVLFKFDISQGPPPKKKFLPQGLRLRPGWALSSYATGFASLFMRFI